MIVYIAHNQLNLIQYACNIGWSTINRYVSNENMCVAKKMCVCENVIRDNAIEIPAK